MPLLWAAGRGQEGVDWMLPEQEDVNPSPNRGDTFLAERNLALAALRRDAFVGTVPSFLLIV